jgi:LmbE family N-acetylglucosaminyl deacetylase
MHTNVILAPHPDDELIGLAAHIACAPDKSSFRIIYASNGAPEVKEWYPIAGCETPKDYAKLRQKEAITALETLGILESQLFFLQFADLSLADVVEDLMISLQGCFLSLKPDAVYLPALEKGHPDHDATHIAGYVAAKRAQVPRIFAFSEYTLIDDKETFNAYHDVPGIQIKPETTVLTDDLREKKIRALREYASQFDDWMKRYVANCDRETVWEVPKYSPEMIEEIITHIDSYYDRMYPLPVHSSDIDRKLLAFVDEALG